MSMEEFQAAIDSGKLVDIWRISDIMLDVRASLGNEYDRHRVDDLMRQLGIQPDGPSVMLQKHAQEILDTMKEEELL